MRTATGTITEAYAKVGIDWRFSVNFKENSLVDAESKNVDSLKTIKKSENEIRERYIKYMIRSYLDKKGDSSRRSMIALDIAYALEILNENFIDRYIKFK